MEKVQVHISDVSQDSLYFNILEGAETFNFTKLEEVEAYLF
jgi:hypothetical protein